MAHLVFEIMLVQSAHLKLVSVPEGSVVCIIIREGVSVV